MKTKLYHKFVKIFCNSYKISRQQLFSRNFDECIMFPHTLNISTGNLIKDDSRLMVLDRRKPLSMTWQCYDFHTRWLIKYWKHSHHKHEIKIRLDLD